MPTIPHSTLNFASASALLSLALEQRASQTTRLAPANAPSLNALELAQMIPDTGLVLMMAQQQAPLNAHVLVL